MKKVFIAAAIPLAALLFISGFPAIYSTAAPEPLLANQPLSEYKARRQRLMEQVKNGVIVLAGAHEDDFGDAGRFRQSNYFQYLTGVETPAAYLLLVPKGLPDYGGAREILFIPPRNPANERWTGPQIGPGAEAEAAFGFERALPSTEFDRVIKNLVTGGQVFYGITPRREDTTQPRELLFAERLRALVGNAELKQVAYQINRQRMTKSESEVAMLQKAIDATGAAQAGVARALRPGVYEYELEGDILAAFLRNGAERPSFPSIIGSGIYSTVLHYDRNRKQIEDGDLVVVDIGAEYSYYAADITRTWPASGRFTPRQREIYDLVLEAQRRVAESVKPGKTYLGALTQETARIFRDSKLRAKDEKGNERAMDYFFIHATGHYLGMDVHDVGDYDRPLRPGDVFTIEPGIYISGERLGVRIEDDYLVTADGVRKLSSAIPSDPNEIERLMKKK
ncbi:MAG TPA: aminopeptidase P N-terminal domain-containing protein [Blastocatellia bacterium]|nr:aminopeptidase P N-terminal domain-containing protein [Blastocatellia bacterium]